MERRSTRRERHRGTREIWRGIQGEIQGRLMQGDATSIPRAGLPRAGCRRGRSLSTVPSPRKHLQRERRITSLSSPACKRTSSRHWNLQVKRTISAASGYSAGPLLAPLCLARMLKSSGNIGDVIAGDVVEREDPLRLCGVNTLNLPRDAVAKGLYRPPGKQDRRAGRESGTGLTPYYRKAAFDETRCGADAGEQLPKSQPSHCP